MLLPLQQRLLGNLVFRHWLLFLLLLARKKSTAKERLGEYEKQQHCEMCHPVVEDREMQKQEKQKQLCSAQPRKGKHRELVKRGALCCC